MAVLSADVLVTDARLASGLTKSAFAAAAGTSRAALDAYEKGERIPRLDVLLRTIEASGGTVRIDVAYDDVRQAVDTLAAVTANLDFVDHEWAWRALISDFVANCFVPASRSDRTAMLEPEPEIDHNPPWRSFVDALAEHLSFHAGISCPAWAGHTPTDDDVPYWWPVHGGLPSMRSAAFAFSSAAFKRRGILIDGRELPRVLP